MYISHCAIQDPETSSHATARVQDTIDPSPITSKVALHQWSHYGHRHLLFIFFHAGFTDRLLFKAILTFKVMQDRRSSFEAELRKSRSQIPGSSHGSVCINVTTQVYWW